VCLDPKSYLLQHLLFFLAAQFIYFNVNVDLLGFVFVVGNESVITFHPSRPVGLLLVDEREGQDLEHVEQLLVFVDQHHLLRHYTNHQIDHDDGDNDHTHDVHGVGDDWQAGV